MKRHQPLPTLEVIFERRDCKPYAVGVTYFPNGGDDRTDAVRHAAQTTHHDLDKALAEGIPVCLRRIADKMEGK